MVKRYPYLMPMMFTVIPYNTFIRKCRVHSRVQRNYKVSNPLWLLYGGPKVIERILKIHNNSFRIHSYVTINWNGHYVNVHVCIRKAGNLKPWCETSKISGCKKSWHNKS